MATRLLPMMAKNYKEQHNKIKWDSAFAQPIISGFRVLVYKKGSIITYTKGDDRKISVSVHISRILRSILPEGLILDGFLYAPDLTALEIKHACKKYNLNTEKLQYHVIDTVSCDDFESRQISLFKVFINHSLNGVQQIPTVKVRSESDLMLCQKVFIESGHEGAMLRYGHSGYEEGTKSNYYLKVTTFIQDNFKVVDYKIIDKNLIFTFRTNDNNFFDVQLTDSQSKQYMPYIADIIGEFFTLKYSGLSNEKRESIPLLPVIIGINK